MLRREFGAGVRERRRRIALIGLRGAGKTTLGAMLAARRRIPFVELDREIELAAGASLAELFLLYGQAAYRRHERRALEALLLRDEAMVIATGGSLVSEPETFDLLLSTCHVVWLKARPEEHMARVVAQGDQRPMAGSGEAMDDLKRILAGRDLLYRKADAIVDTSGKSIAQSLRLLEHAAGVAVGATRVG
jgi:XRE family aerobic/anaerobic benzoate catabolism transcriptional regulator